MSVRLGRLHLGTFAWYLSFENFRFGTFALELPFGIRRLAVCPWHLSFGSSAPNFRLITIVGLSRIETFAWELSHGSSRLGIFALDLSLGIFRLGTIALDFIAWGPSLGYFRSGSFA